MKYDGLLLSLLILQAMLALAVPVSRVRKVFLSDDNFTQRLLRHNTQSLLNFHLKPQYRDQVFLHFGSITRIPTDAIANSVDEYCLGARGAVNKAINKAVGQCAATGKGMLREQVAKTLSPVSAGWKRCPVGTARPIRVPWHLPAKGRTLNGSIKYILQASGPKNQERYLLLKTYWSILQTAHALGVRHVAIPSIATGDGGGFPTREALHIAVWTVKKFLDETGSRLQVVFVTNDKTRIRYYSEAMARFL